MVTLRDRVVGEDNHHDLLGFEVGTTLCVELGVPVTESIELLHCELPPILIEDDHIIAVCREADPVIVIGSEEDPKTTVLPGFQHGGFPSVCRTVDPVVTLFHCRIEWIGLRPEVGLLLLFEADLLVDLEVLLDPLEVTNSKH